MTKRLEADTSKNRPNIHHYKSIASGSAYVTDLKPYAARYRQTSRLLGGYWSASFDLPGFSISKKKSFFKWALGDHIKCTFGGEHIFEGIVWSMDLYTDGVRRRRTMDDLRNKIKVAYTTLSGGETARTSWQSHADSISKWGTIEEILSMGKIKHWHANRYAGTVLPELANPYSYPMTFKEPEINEEDQLQVEVVGYIYTFNYRYVDISNKVYTISDALKELLTQNNQYLIESSIQSNGTEVAPPDGDTRVWEWAQELVEIGSGNDPFVFQVWNDRRASYFTLNPEPTIVWDGHKFTTKAGRHIKSNHYTLRPGVLRDLTYEKADMPPEYFLRDSRDSLVHEVEAGEEYTQPIMKTIHYEDSETLAAWVRNRVELHDYKEDPENKQ